MMEMVVVVQMMMVEEVIEMISIIDEFTKRSILQSHETA